MTLPIHPLNFRFNKRRSWYNASTSRFSSRSDWQNGLPVTINGRRYPDARKLMQDLVHWYWYEPEDKIIVQGIPEETKEALTHLGAFHPISETNPSIVQAGPRHLLVQIIDTLSLHLDNRLFNSSTSISTKFGVRVFENRNPS